MRRIVFILFLLFVSCCCAIADDHKEKKQKNISPVTNELYRSSCGGCHFAYQPGLLPKRSWTKIIDARGMHSGGDLTLDKATREIIKAYLVHESADNSSSERSRKILASLSNSDIPIRITDIPYIKKKHKNIGEDIFRRPSVGSAGNCKSCHRSAEQGVYEDDDVVIPSQ